MQPDLERMRGLAQELYQTMVLKKFGDGAVTLLRMVLASVHDVYKWIDPETHDGQIVIFRPLKSRVRFPSDPKGVLVSDLSNLPQLIHKYSCIQIEPDGRLLLYRNLRPKIPQLSKLAVVYQYSNRSEWIWAGGESRKIPNPYIGCASAFSFPTFSDLREALESYDARMAKSCLCPILLNSFKDINRVFLSAGPEYIMRNSLVHFLKAAIRGAEVRPEQNMDASHPVDIKVTSILSNRLAVIEIKWLGQVKNPNGSLGVKYSSSRANEGAAQLAGYLDMNKAQTPNQITRGYLVVYDARRKALTAATRKINSEKGLFFRDKHIEYSPKYHLERSDFEEPLRFFMEPQCT